MSKIKILFGVCLSVICGCIAMLSIFGFGYIFRFFLNEPFWLSSGLPFIVICSLFIFFIYILKLKNKWVYYLLFVVSSIGCIIWISFNSSPHSTSVYRNGRRLVAISTLQSTLELYFKDNQKYPKELKELMPLYIGYLTQFPEFIIEN